MMGRYSIPSKDIPAMSYQLHTIPMDHDSHRDLMTEQLKYGNMQIAQQVSNLGIIYLNASIVIYHIRHPIITDNSNVFYHVLLPGTFQSVEGQITCDYCEAGTYQPLRGQISCHECRSGGYCPNNAALDNTDGGFTPCPIGTYNSDTGRSDATSCSPCPEGK